MHDCGCIYSKLPNWIFLIGFIILVLGGHGCEAGPNWYRGCYFLPDMETSGRSRQPLYEVSRNWTPAKCAKKCWDEKEYSFAFLFNGNACFCRKYLTRKVYESSCNQRCKNDRAFKCGGTTSVSAYSVNGPYIASIHVVVRPKKVVKNQEVKITVMVELAADVSTKIGVMRFDHTSFRSVEVTANLVYRSKKKIRNMIIKGRKGQIEFTHKYNSEGLKPIDIVVKNKISTLSTRRYIQVESRIPRDLTIGIARQNSQMCTPTSHDGDTVFVGEEVTFRASVESGFNLTFTWNFCGIETRNLPTHMVNPSCVDSVCHTDAQPFIFEKSEMCNVIVRVFNNFGSVTSQLPVSVITPELRSLSVIALPLTWGGEYSDGASGENTQLEPWGLPGESISEGETGGRAGDYSPDNFPSNNYPSKINFYPFGDRDVTPSPPAEQTFRHHIKLENGQFLKETPIKFEASAFVTNFEKGSFVEIDFGDGDIIFQEIEIDYHGFPQMRRKRSIRDLITKWTKLNNGLRVTKEQKTALEDTVFTNNTYYAEFEYKQRPKRSITETETNYEDYLNSLDNLAPYSSMRQGEDSPRVQFASRDGGFRTSEGFDFDPASYELVEIIYGDNCQHTLKFDHSFQTSGRFNVTMKLYNGTDSLTSSVKSGLEILDGTPELNLRCPESTELGKSIILSVSSIKELPNVLTWMIFRKTDEEEMWTEDENLEQTGYSLKRSFLSRGFYKIVVYSSDEDSPATCELQVEEPLSGLTVTSDLKYITTGSTAVVKISLEAGTSANLRITTDDFNGNSNIEQVGKRKWHAIISIDKTQCYNMIVNARNPVSNISSDIVEICGEEPIYGLTIHQPKISDLDNKVPVNITFESGSNVHLTVNIFSQYGSLVASYERKIRDSGKHVEIYTSKLTELGIYRIVAQANNRVPAKTKICDKLPYVTSESEVLVTKLIPPETKIFLEKRQMSRVKDNQNVDVSWTYVYDAKINDENLCNDKGYLYRWTLQTVTVLGDKNIGVLIRRYTSSPIFSVDLKKCYPVTTSSDDVVLKYGVSKAAEMYNAQNPVCKVSVEIISPTNNATNSHLLIGEPTKSMINLILPQTSVIETKKSCEFDIKCPDKAAPVCEVSFGDGSEPMKIPSNANWNSLSHAFTKAGLYIISIQFFDRPTRKSIILNTTHVIVQDQISSLQLEGSKMLSYEENPSGVWKATIVGGSNVVYHWSVKYDNETILHQEYTRAKEWGLVFPSPGNYYVEVVAFNDISRQVRRQSVSVLHTPWYFNVQANSSILGKPSSFILSTNASSNIVAVRFENTEKTIEYDLGCLEPNFTTTNDENKIIKSYVISHTYNQTGSYEATFSLLSRAGDDMNERLYTLKTEVLHKPAPKNLLLEIVGGNTIEYDGNYYVATSTEVVIRATTNFHTEFFSWDVWSIHSMRRDMIHPPSPVEATNSSTAEFSYMIEQQGLYEISATSHTNIVKSSLKIEAQEVIRKVWVDKPYNARDTKFVNFCRLKRLVVNKTVELRCDSLTLTAFSYGSRVTFHFHIKFRPEVLDDYTVPTEVVDIIQAKSKRKPHGPANEASIEYAFNRQGVYSITVVASNNLGNRSAEIPPEKPSFGPTRPFLFYAQRPVARIFLEQSTFYVALNTLSTFKVNLLNNKQVVEVKWDMGDGTKLRGETVMHTYRTPGIKTMNVVAKNHVNAKTASAYVKVEIPIQEVKIQEMPLTYSTSRHVRLSAFVKPSQSASNYTWYLRNDNNTETSYRNSIEHWFTKSGMYLVKVIAANRVSSVESVPIEIEIQEPIHAKFIGDEVVRRNEEILMSVQLLTGSDVTIYWRIDGEHVGNNTFDMTHTFRQKGQYKVQINLTNKLGTFNIEKLIFVEDRTCEIPRVRISKGDIRIKRSKPLRLEAEVHLNCSFLATLNYQWKAHFDKYKTIEVELNDTETNTRILELEPRTLEYGTYYFTVDVSVADTILFGSTTERIGVFPSQLIAMIDGGNVRSINRSADVIIDASLSYDPDFPENKHDLFFEWQCFVLNSPNTPCFKSSLDDGEIEEIEEEHHHDVNEYSTPSTDEPESETSSMRAADEYITEEAREGNVHRDFPKGVSRNESILQFHASTLVHTADAFVFKIDVSKLDPRARRSKKVLVLKIERDPMEWVKIHCHNCKSGAVARHVPLQFEANCVTCSNNPHDDDSLSYEWSMHEVEDNSASFYENDTSDCAPPDGTGWMSITGIFGNESEFTNGSDTDPLHQYLTNITDDTALHEDSNFFGNLIPEDVLTNQWPANSQKPPRLPVGGGLSEGKSPARNGGPSRYIDDEDGIPPVPLKRVLRTASPVFVEDETNPESFSPDIPENDIVGSSNMKDGYGIDGQRPLGAPPSHNMDEALTGSRFEGGGNYNYGSHGPSYENEWASRSGIIPYSPGMNGLPLPLPPTYGDSQRRGDAFRTSDHSSNIPLPNHYQDLKHAKLQLQDIALTGINDKTLVIRSNTLTEGRTYAITNEIFKTDNKKKIMIGRTSYYFTVLRGPSYGDCSVVYRDLTKNYFVHCAGWKNQQNDNAMDSVSRREMLNYDISYSLTKAGPHRQIYAGVNHEKHFHLPNNNEPAYIHIVLKNSDGASTYVCSFLPSGPIRTNASSTAFDILQKIYSEAVPADGKLGEMMAMGNQEEVIALVNVLLDTIPKEHDLQALEEEIGEYVMEKSRQILFNITTALKSVSPRKINEVQFVIETLTRAISRSKLVSARTFFEAANLLLKSVDTLRIVTHEAMDSGNDQYILSDETMMNTLVFARLAFSESCQQCAIRIDTEPSTEEVKQAEAMLFRNFTDVTRAFSVKSKLLTKEKEIYAQLNKFFLDLITHRPPVLGPIRSQVDGQGIVVQSFSKVVNIFANDDVIFGKSGSWKVGSVFPNNVTNRSKLKSKVSDLHVIASTLPDMTLSNFKKNSIERRPISLSVYDTESSKLPIHDVNPPMIIALPPRNLDKVSEFRGIISRDRVSTNSFPVNKIPNRTLHLEILLSTRHQRSFPVTIAVTKPSTDHHPGPPNPDQIVSKQVVSRGQFQDYNALNETIVVKFTLRYDHFSHKHGMYYIAFWNEQAMTSRSRHYDIESVSYTLRIWWSDCFYWDEFFSDWRQDGVQTMDQSTSTQTLCTTSHLSTFSSSYIPVRTDAQASDIGIAITHTALRGSVSILSVIIVATIVFLYVHHRILRPRELETPTSVFRVDYYGSQPRFSEIGKKLRWFFGPDKKSNTVPIILHDNRKSHSQVFEVTLQTSCWPGSGTTSNVTMILYGEEGKYDARELISPKTHLAREARYENGYSENDDYTGVDDELFITGSTQKFIITYPENLGPLWKLVIWHDHSGECPKWKLDYITVRDVKEKKKWHFPYYDWLALDKSKKSLSAQLRPLYSPPSLYMQVGLRMNYFLCNFSSVCSFIASPCYGQQPRNQRAIHLVSLFVAICGLTTARYMLEWDIYSHDTDLPYIHTVSKSWGLLIGIFASLIVLPAQILSRFSKHDEKISVTIEDATMSILGTDFPDDNTSYRYTSSINIAKPPENHMDDHDHDIAYEGYHNSVCALPSVEDTVCDWLEFKAKSEQSHVNSRVKNTINKELYLPEARSSVASPHWRQSSNSLDEEIVRCMMTSTESKKSQILSMITSEEKPQFLDDDVKPRMNHDIQSTPATPPQIRRGVSKIHVNSFLAEQYASMGGIYSSLGSTLAMDGPELVPCEKLEPIPQDFSALLPRSCRKIVWLYYLLLCLGAAGVTIYGSLFMIRSYDLGPWMECIVFATICSLVLVEGFLIILFAVLTSIYSKLKWIFVEEKLWNLLDSVFSTSDVSSVTENALDSYIDSPTAQPPSSNDCLSSNAEILLEDARIARQLADRERTRYLRNVEPPSEVPEALKKEIKLQKLSKANCEWINVLFLLVVGITAAVIVSNRFVESNSQSRDVEDWFKRTSTFPSSGGYITSDMYDMRNSTTHSFQNINSRKDWLEWFNKVLMDCPKSKERAKLNSRRKNSPESYLSRESQKSKYQPPGSKNFARYILIGTPTLIVKQFETYLNKYDIPSQVRVLLNYTTPKTSTSTYADSVPQVNAMLVKKTSPEPESSTRETTITYQIPSWVAKTPEAVARLSAPRRVIEHHVTVNSVCVDVILYNPYANLYSHISATSKFHSKTGVIGFEKSFSHSKITVSSLSLSLAGVDRMKTSAAWKSFFICQMLLLCWCGCRFLRSIIGWTNKIMRSLATTASFKVQNGKTECPTLLLNFSLSLLDLFIWCLAFLCIGISASRRARIESVMPYIYGYDATNGDTYKSLPFVDIIRSSTRLSTTYGMLNFFLIIKLLTILRIYHDFPKFPKYSKNQKIAMGQIFSILIVFIATTITLAFIGYLIFSDDVSFSSFIQSLASVLLTSISLGALPANSSVDIKALRAKYGTLVTFWFFFTIFVMSRLIMKGLLVAVFRKRSRNSKSNDEVDPKSVDDVTISFTELLRYNWDRIKYLGLSFVCIILQRDPGMWSAHNDIEFTSLGFSKSKQLTDREKKKLGSTMSSSHRSTPVKPKVMEQKKEDVNYKTKYKLPSGVWLTEIETQLDELYSRASALADIAHNEIPSEELISAIYQKYDTKNSDIEVDDREFIPSSPTLVRLKDHGQTLDGDLDRSTLQQNSNNSVTTGKPPIRRTVANNKRNPRRRCNINKLATISKEKQANENGKDSKNASDIITPKRHSPLKASQVRPTTPPLQKVHPRKEFGHKQFNSNHIVRDVSTILTSQDTRKYGWISDDDMLDRSSDISGISSSSFTSSNTPVPPLTKHNLARHNYHIISRQTSTMTGSSGRTGNTVRLSDVPSTSTAPYEAPTEPPPTVGGRIWRTLSTIKRLFGREEIVQEEHKTKVRPLRRSRTTAINVKDLPSLGSLRDSDGESDRTGKKSSASTTKMRSVLNGARRGIEQRKRTTRVRNIEPEYHIRSPISSRSQFSDTSSRRSVSGDLQGHDDLETFSIPGTVIEEPQKLNNRKNSRESGSTSKNSTRVRSKNVTRRSNGASRSSNPTIR